MKKERTSAQVVVEDVMKIKKNERVLIIANPATTQIAQDLYSASEEKGAFPVLIFHRKIYFLFPVVYCWCFVIFFSMLNTSPSGRYTTLI